MLSRVYTQITSKTTERYTTSKAIRKLQIKTMRCPFRGIRAAIRDQNQPFWGIRGEIRTFTYSWVNLSYSSMLGNSFVVLQNAG